MSAPDSEILIGDQSDPDDKTAAGANEDLLAELERLKACVAALEAKARQSSDVTAEQDQQTVQDSDVKSQPEVKQDRVTRPQPPARQEPEDQSQPAAANKPALAKSQSKPGKNGKSTKPADEKQPDAKVPEAKEFEAKEFEAKEPVVAVKPPRPTRQPDTEPSPATSQPKSAASKVPARPRQPVTTDDHKTNGKATVEEDRKTRPARPESDRKKVPRPVPLGAPDSGTDRAPPRPSATNQPQPDSTSDSEQQPADEVAKPKRRWLTSFIFRESVPGWSASMIVHAIGLVALALLTLTLPEEEKEIPIVANSVEVIDDMEEIEEELELEVEKPIVEEFVPDVSDVIEDPGEAIMGDLNQTETAAPSDLGDLATIDVGALGLDIDLMGDGKGKKGDGIGVASFFGVTTRGRKFMYVVDNSNSMSNGKFEMACNELFKSISGLSYDHEFYIIFYSDAAYPLFYPRSAPRWVKATPDNVEKVRYWLDEVHRCLQTRGEEAMTKAFQMRPDVIYLLGDGSFTDKAVPTTLGFNDSNVVVHTMGFGMKESARKGFEQISGKFKGKFHEVEVVPAAIKASKEKNRPKNNQQNGVWGINLGKGKKKK